MSQTLLDIYLSERLQSAKGLGWAMPETPEPAQAAVPESAQAREPAAPVAHLVA